MGRRRCGASAAASPGSSSSIQAGNHSGVISGSKSCSKASRHAVRSAQSGKSAASITRSNTSGARWHRANHDSMALARSRSLQRASAIEDWNMAAVNTVLLGIDEHDRRVSPTSNEVGGIDRVIAGHDHGKEVERRTHRYRHPHPPCIRMRNGVRSRCRPIASARPSGRICESEGCTPHSTNRRVEPSPLRTQNSPYPMSLASNRIQA